MTGTADVIPFPVPLPPPNWAVIDAWIEAMGLSVENTAFSTPRPRLVVVR